MSSKNQVLLKLIIPTVDQSLLVVKVSKPENFLYYDIPLKIGTFSFPSIYPIDENGLPILEKYINRSGFSWTGNDSFLAAQYPEEFPPADPPMADMKPLVPQVNNVAHVVVPHAQLWSTLMCVLLVVILSFWSLYDFATASRHRSNRLI